jgi:hypothetical protein
MSLKIIPPHTTTTDGTGSRSPRRHSARLIADAVVASYLHNISQRHRPAVPAAEQHLLRPTPER